MKDTYMKPELTSEVLDPEVLLVTGSPADGGGDGGDGGDGGEGPVAIWNPLFGICCD